MSNEPDIFYYYESEYPAKAEYVSASTREPWQGMRDKDRTVGRGKRNYPRVLLFASKVFRLCWSRRPSFFKRSNSRD